MHDDLIDGVGWLVGEGIADRARVGIYGGSYGGYAALVGATFTPDVFAAAVVSVVGPSSLVSLVRSFPPYWRPFLASTWFRYVGDPEDPEQRADLEARSPLNRVDDIRCPLLVVQGANDPRVTKAESDQIVAALRARGVTVEYLVKEDEGHGFVKPENRMDAYGAIERFFANHLGGRRRLPGGRGYRWVVLAVGMAAQASISALQLGLPAVAPELRSESACRSRRRERSSGPRRSASSRPCSPGAPSPTGSASGP